MDGFGGTTEEAGINLIEGARDLRDVVDGHRLPTAGRIFEQVEGLDRTSHADLCPLRERMEGRERRPAFTPEVPERHMEDCSTRLWGLRLG